MKETVALLGTIFALVLAIVAILLFGLWATSELCCRIRAARRKVDDNPRPGWQFQADLNTLDRWCCWHFPIIADVCEYLSNPCDIDRFRNQLIQKYGERNGLPFIREEEKNRVGGA